MTSTKRVVFLSGLLLTLFFFGAPQAALAASYNLTTDKETFGIGDTFNVDVKISSPDVGINAAQATITFPKDTVQVTSLDKGTSSFDFWLQGPSYSNETGQVTLIGGSQSGISGKSLEVLRIAFKVKGAGAVSIIFTDGAVTASDGSGTNVLTAMNGLQLTSTTSATPVVIAPPAAVAPPTQIVRPAAAATGLPAKPVISVPLYPDTSAWYQDVTKFIVQWSLPPDVTAVAAAIDRQPSFEPTNSDGLFNNEVFSPLSDGVWYLHVRFKNSIGWGSTMHYRIAIDSAPPLSFTVTSPDDLTTANFVPSIVYSTNDQPSGINGYNVLIDNKLATTTTSTKYTLPPQQPGNHTVVVQAVDMAGNKTESRITFTILEIPLITIAGIGITKTSFFTTIILALIIGGALGWYVGRKQKEQRLRRLVIAQRDVQTSFDTIQKEISGLLSRMNDEGISAQAEHEMKIVLTRISDGIKKKKQYIVENMEDIES
ncbi:MAG: cohesin domain-containing protein [Minisyncoccia bacterium]